MADTRGDDLAPVIQEILRKNYLQASKRKETNTANQPRESIASLDNTEHKEQTIIMIGQKGKDGKPQFNTIVETDKNGALIVQQVNQKGQLEDVTNQYNAIVEGQKQALASSNRIDKDISNDIVPNRKEGQQLEDLNQQIYAKENVRTNGELDRKVEQKIQEKLYQEKAINDTLNKQRGRISFQEFNHQLNLKGLEARLAKTGEDLNEFPKVKVQIYNPNNPNESTDWTKFKAKSIDNIKDKVDLSQEYQHKFNTEIVLAQRADFKKKLEMSELSSNKIVMTRDGERVNFSFEDNKGNKEVLEKLNKLPNNDAIQIAQQYNENINQSGKGIKPTAKAYDQKIANAIPLPQEQRNEQKRSIA